MKKTKLDLWLSASEFAQKQLGEACAHKLASAALEHFNGKGHHPADYNDWSGFANELRGKFQGLNSQALTSVAVEEKAAADKAAVLAGRATETKK